MPTFIFNEKLFYLDFLYKVFVIPPKNYLSNPWDENVVENNGWNTDCLTNINSNRERKLCTVPLNLASSVLCDNLIISHSHSWQADVLIQLVKSMLSLFTTVICLIFFKIASRYAVQYRSYNIQSRLKVLAVVLYRKNIFVWKCQANTGMRPLHRPHWNTAAKTLIRIRKSFRSGTGSAS